MNSIGERLKSVRINKGLTQEELSVKTGVSRSNISRIEKDAINPSSTIIVQLCEALEISADWLLTGSGQKYKKGESVPVPEGKAVFTVRPFGGGIRERTMSLEDWKIAEPLFDRFMEEKEKERKKKK